MTTTPTPVLDVPTLEYIFTLGNAVGNSVVDKLIDEKNYEGVRACIAAGYTQKCDPVITRVVGLAVDETPEGEQLAVEMTQAWAKGSAKLCTDALLNSLQFDRNAAAGQSLNVFERVLLRSGAEIGALGVPAHIDAPVRVKRTFVKNAVGPYVDEVALIEGEEMISPIALAMTRPGAPFLLTEMFRKSDWLTKEQEQVPPAYQRHDGKVVDVIHAALMNEQFRVFGPLRMVLDVESDVVQKSVSNAIEHLITTVHSHPRIHFPATRQAHNLFDLLHSGFKPEHGFWNRLTPDGLLFQEAFTGLPNSRQSFIHAMEPLAGSILGDKARFIDMLSDLALQGVNLAAPDAMGRTLLAAAAMGDNLEIFKYLVEQGLDPNAKDGKNHNAAYYSKRSVDGQEVMQFIAAASARDILKAPSKKRLQALA